ncbi:MAG: bifunctional phosphoribosylaminoimidazolecarboxamide formyltransferase/IMP cyclohydrolase [Zetaproteobacteria bacterium]|nr:bifunctional phosphoribosylaminoimidazolecarboxamide formyltransferase/IMP cyclohydrolase [Zetaproteobacteria bacterium]
MDLDQPIALISVSDKTGVVDFARGLLGLGWKLISTGGTAVHLQQRGLQVESVESFTDFPAIISGKVKTLHPKIFGSIMGDPEHPSEQEDIHTFGLQNIRMVIVNFYPFEKVMRENPEMSVVDAHHLIDIGGPALLRAAAKSLSKCLPIVDPEDYDSVLGWLQEGKRLDRDSLECLQLIHKVFVCTCNFDAQVSAFFASKIGIKSREAVMPLGFETVKNLRYGENPHQQAKLLAVAGHVSVDLKLHEARKKLSYNNILDLHYARRAVAVYPRGYVAVVLKHNNPCGVGHHLTSPQQALEKALTADPQSAFGGILAMNFTVDHTLASLIKPLFVECLSAPEVTPEALKLIQEKKNLRILVEPVESLGLHSELRQVGDYGYLLQGQDALVYGNRAQWKVASEKQPTPEQLDDLDFAFCVAARVKSNAIVLARHGQTIGIGAGQMSRIDAVQFALSKASGLGHVIRGAVLASDGFFPFGDCVELAERHGIHAIIQPGGSIRDQDSIEVANRAGICLVMTGERHFMH